ncbi:MULTISPECIES: sensor domain-containing diguanylate cyclase [unclassified Sedimentibacter]|uniref:sensor domain-containing diguanylate cyclase n=1 Tax=unclassified Sedimentibacter TaxID=2649220 RepID=UPI0027E19A58|nr:sensor domain-containing diguanylate cyclase [Sedimentibacter sp. MB35-C1]WMJ77246.1 sensor domain-containing diguanylate cyclase [Sedimentibacter sp. MB35-C1]
MNFRRKYEDELNKLKENENNIDFFRNLLSARHNNYFMKEIIEGLLKFSKEHNLNSVNAWAYYFLGWYNFDKSNYNKSTECFLTSYDVFERIKNKDGLIYACNGLTNVYCQIGQFKLANEWGLKGISLCEEMDNKDALVILLINTGINYIEMKYFEKGREIFHSLEIMDYELSSTHQISCNLAMAEIEINIGESSKALSYIEKSLKIESDIKLITDMCEIYKLTAMAYVKLNLYDMAEKSFKKSYDFAVDNNFVYEKYSSMVEWSKLNVLVGRKQKAIYLLNEVIEICRSKELNVLLRESYNILYGIYKESGMLDKALECLENYILVDDKMYDYEQNQLMAKMNFKHTKREADQYKSLYGKTELLSTIGQKIISNLNIKSIVDIINEEINKLLEADYFGIVVYDNEKDKATYYFAGEGFEIKEVVSYKESAYNFFGYYCVKNKKDIIIGNLDKEYNQYINNEPIDVGKTYENGKSYMNSLIYTPMIINDKVVGVMTAQSKEHNAYDRNDLHTLKILANYSAIAIENAISYKKIEDLATYDNLTSFLSKFEIIRLGEIIFDKYKDSNLGFSVTMIDIDNFKSVNDTYGHVVGDSVLAMVARVISSCIRNTDYIGRYGGDEFLLICPGLGEPEAVDVAERIRYAVENKVFELGKGIVVSVTISLGVHEYKEKDLSFIDVLNLADKNLYCAKGNNRNLVVCC